MPMHSWREREYSSQTFSPPVLRCFLMGFAPPLTQLSNRPFILGMALVVLFEPFLFLILLSFLFSRLASSGGWVKERILCRRSRELLPSRVCGWLVGWGRECVSVRYAWRRRQGLALLCFAVCVCVCVARRHPRIDTNSSFQSLRKGAAVVAE